MNKEVFKKKAGTFQEALERSGYEWKIEWQREREEGEALAPHYRRGTWKKKDKTERSKNNNRARNEMYFTPPMSKYVEGNIWREFRELVEEN